MASLLDGFAPGTSTPGKLISRPTGSLRLQHLTAADFKALSQNSFLVYVCVLMLGSMLYHQLGGSLHGMEVKDQLGYLSTVAEGFGLLSLRSRIKSQGSVAGISGVSMALYLIYYTVRGFFEMPPFSMEFLDAWPVKVLEQISWLLVLDVIRSMFFTHRSSYRSDLDVLRIWYIVPACTLLALAFHPDDENLAWTATMYMDTVALLPQVMMMARGDGTVAAPISHFVFATAFSRGVDLYYWCWWFHATGMNYNGWVVLSAHVVYQLLVADFLYYYLKQRLASRSLSEDLILPEDDII